MPDLRVLHLLDTEQMAGTERHVITLLSFLGAAGVGAALACRAGGPLYRAALQEGLEVVAVRGRFWSPVGLRSLRATARRLGADLLHAHNGRTTAAAVLAACAPVVATQHFLAPAHTTRGGWGGLAARWAHRWVNRRVARFIAVSQAARQAMVRRGTPPARIDVVLHGTAPPDPAALPTRRQQRAELGVDEAALLVACCARLEPEKDVGTLVDAMSAASGRLPGAVCLIVGEGSQRQDLLQRAQRTGLFGQVRLLGYRSDALAIVSACDLFVLPSLAEPFGLAILEAMALGKPVIATAAGGPLELVVDGRTGLLVPAQDPAVLADAIVALGRDAERRRRMGDEARCRFVACFTADRMAQQTAAVYRTTLGRPTAAAVGGIVVGAVAAGETA